jgi:putative ABC transport system permease protein
MRKLWFGIQLALDTLRGHKFRAFLTVLGVIIGTSTVIGVGSIIAGLDGAITNQLKSFGTNNLVVTKWDSLINGFGGRSLEERLRKPLTYENAVAIAERCPSVESVSPWLFAPWGIHKGKYKGIDAFNLNLGGTDPGYIESGVEMYQGRFFTDTENLRRLPVVVLGEDLGKSWFQNTDPIGKPVEIDGHIFEVVGVMKRPTASMPGQEDRRALFPYFTMRKMFPNAKEHMLIVVAREGRQAAAIDETRAVLRMERKLGYNKPDSFAISTAEQMIDQFRGVIAMVALVMVVLSSIGLLVGGIGVMNIMLVSVTERTREIGTRKALGARRIDIVTQFLTEAVVLTFLGGLAGMGVGWLISQGVGMVFPTLPTAVPLWAVMAGLGVSVGVGLFFGIWPASKAARLDPVVALRYE